jgi:hypothetical protein
VTNFRVGVDFHARNCQSYNELTAAEVTTAIFDSIPLSWASYGPHSTSNPINWRKLRLSILTVLQLPTIGAGYEITES